MKRRNVEVYEFLYNCRTWFFWKKCEKCKQDFRGEKGFRALTSPYCNGRGVWRYLCESCSPSVKFASDYFLNNKWRTRRPLVQIRKAKK